LPMPVRLQTTERSEGWRKRTGIEPAEATTR
jgi:hypothetical protein